MNCRDWSFDVDISNWSKRRRAMIEMLNNPKMPAAVIPQLHKSAEALAEKLEEHDHPQCADMVREHLAKRRKNARRTG